MKKQPSTTEVEASDALKVADAAKRLLAEEKAKQDALLASIGDGVIGTDQEGKIVVMNNAAKTMLGWTAEEVMGKNLFEIVVVEDEQGKTILKNKRPLATVFQTGEAVTIAPTFYIAKDKKRIPVAINVRPIVLNGKVIGTVNVFRDITKEAALERSREEFESLATHQLRAPISVIKWNSEMLSNKDRISADDENSAFTAIKRATDLLTDLVDAILDISKMESGALAINPEPVHLPDLVEALSGEILEQIDTHRLTFEKHYEDDLPLINVDPKLTTAIFRNLLSNAIKYTPNGGRILLKIEKQIQDILITISDTGIGVPLHQQSKLFTKFFRATNVQAGQIEGTGLGLYIVKLIVEQSGGRIWFESQQDKGTTFYVAIPLEGMKMRRGMRGLA